MGTAQSPESVVREISRRVRNKYGTEEKTERETLQPRRRCNRLLTDTTSIIAGK